MVFSATTIYKHFTCSIFRKHNKIAETFYDAKICCYFSVRSTNFLCPAQFTNTYLNTNQYTILTMQTMHAQQSSHCCLWQGKFQNIQQQKNFSNTPKYLPHFLNFLNKYFEARTHSHTHYASLGFSLPVPRTLSLLPIELARCWL